MARTARTKVRAGEYRTDGERLVRILYEAENGDNTWVEDARTLEWEEIVTSKLETWRIVKEASNGVT